MFLRYLGSPPEGADDLAGSVDADRWGEDREIDAARKAASCSLQREIGPIKQIASSIWSLSETQPAPASAFAASSAKPLARNIR